MDGGQLDKFIADGHAFAVFIMLLPFLSVIILLMMGKWRARGGGWLATVLIGLAFLFSLFQAFGFNFHYGKSLVHTASLEWINLGPGAKILFATRLDALTSMMFALVTGVSLLVHIFSLEYMRREPHFHRYFAYLGLFCFSMLGLVLCNDLVFIFFFWELVGFSSYLLIGFWFRRPGPAYASMKAFIINRIGDLGFLIGILIVMAGLGTTHLTDLQSELLNISLSGTEFNIEGSWLSRNWMIAAGISLFMGAVGKSAQFPLQIWLPDAMEGPTPVSSLIHAATMVAAGVYLLARVHFLMLPEVLHVVTIVGAITALMAAVSALVQNDIKKVLAWSTVSQLGFMVTAMGVSEVTASLFHLITHAFFKCGLFLVAGAVIHALHKYHRDLEKEGIHVDFDPQDLRTMGGLRHILKKTGWFYLPMAAALAGIPLFSGFLSKDAILLGIVDWALDPGGVTWRMIIPLMMFAAATLTGFYIARQGLMVFFGENRLFQKYPQLKAAKTRIEPVNAYMWVPLAILSVCSVWLVFNWNPFAHLADVGWLSSFPYASGVHSAAPLPGAEAPSGHLTEWLVPVLSILLALSGVGFAYLRWRSGAWFKESVAGEPTGLRKLAFQHFYLNNVYEKAILPAFLKLTELLALFDRKVVDGAVEGLAYSVARDPEKNNSLSSLAAAFDRVVIDGIVNKIAEGADKLGQGLRKLQPGKVQSYLVFTAIGLLLVVAYLIYFVTR